MGGKGLAVLEAEAGRDPVENYPLWLIEHGFASAEEIEAIRADVDSEIESATDRALNAPVPEATKEHVELHVYSEQVDPTSAAFELEDAIAPIPDCGLH